MVPKMKGRQICELYLVPFIEDQILMSPIEFENFDEFKTIVLVSYGPGLHYLA